MTNAHLQYNLHALLYAIQLAHEGQFDRLVDYGLTRDEANRLLRCSIPDLDTVIQSARTPLVKPVFDRQALAIGFAALDRRVHEDDLIVRLVRAGATTSLLKEHYGLDSRDVGVYRRLHGPDDAAESGRPPKPPESVQYTIWSLWRESPQWNLSVPETLLRIHEATDVLIRTISLLIRGWEDGQDAPAAPPAPPKSQQRGG